MRPEKCWDFILTGSWSRNKNWCFLWWTGDISSCFHGNKEDISDERSPVVMCEASESRAMLLVTTLGVFNGHVLDVFDKISGHFQSCLWQQKSKDVEPSTAVLSETKKYIFGEMLGHFPDVFSRNKSAHYWQDSRTFCRCVCVNETSYFSWGVGPISRCVCGDRTRYFQSKHEVFLTLTKLPMLKHW